MAYGIIDINGYIWLTKRINELKLKLGIKQ